MRYFRSGLSGSREQGVGSTEERFCLDILSVGNYQDLIQYTISKLPIPKLPIHTKLRSKVQLSLPPISLSPYLPISLSPYLPISLSSYPTNLLSLNATRYQDF
ncbi:hypothetical protein [Moorena producens]|uniref:hypothetical protein n=1 Tax=Moorena producens TaxID=1155739 RepID=UPI003C7700CA